jgi:hypothetical protein
MRLKPRVEQILRTCHTLTIYSDLVKPTLWNKPFSKSLGVNRMFMLGIVLYGP